MLRLYSSTIAFDKEVNFYWAGVPSCGLPTEYIYFFKDGYNLRFDVFLDLRADSPERVKRFPVGVIQFPVFENFCLLPAFRQTRSTPFEPKQKICQNRGSLYIHSWIDIRIYQQRENSTLTPFLDHCPFYFQGKNVKSQTKISSLHNVHTGTIQEWNTIEKKKMAPWFLLGRKRGNEECHRQQAAKNHLR